MASPLEEIKIALKITDANASEVVKKLESSFRGLARSATQLDTKGISKVRDRVKSFDNAGRKNIETIRGQINAMQSLRSQAEIGSKQFRQLTADVNKYSQELARAEGRGSRRGVGGRVGGFVKAPQVSGLLLEQAFLVDLKVLQVRLLVDLLAVSQDQSLVEPLALRFQT